MLVKQKLHERQNILQSVKQLLYNGGEPGLEKAFAPLSVVAHWSILLRVNVNRTLAPCTNRATIFLELGLLLYNRRSGGSVSGPCVGRNAGCDLPSYIAEPVFQRVPSSPPSATTKFSIGYGLHRS